MTSATHPAARPAVRLAVPAGGVAEGREPEWRLVTRKELGDLAGRVGRRAFARTLAVVAIFGILVPLRFEGATNLPAFFAVFMAFLPARLVAIDSFAGERERGTLEGLLASPLSDRGIAVGKIVASTVYGASRGWLFLAVWSASAGLLRLSGLIPDAPLPSPAVALAVALAGVVVAYAAAVFGIWQSAFAPSVRAIVESGGLLRLLVIVGVFFVGPWLLGLLSPDGRAPELPLPGSGRTVSLEALLSAGDLAPGSLWMSGTLLATAGLVALSALTVATLRRCRREALALVTAVEPPAARSRLARLRRFARSGGRGRNQGVR